MSEVVTLAERHRRRMEHMRSALEEVDARLVVYARREGGRFIRYGSTAKGHASSHSDIDIIADFPEEASLKAAGYAEELCFAHGLTPDVRPSCWTSESFVKLVAADGIILA